MHTYTLDSLNFIWPSGNIYTRYVQELTGGLNSPCHYC